MPLKTTDLPIGTRPPLIYKAKAVAFELRVNPDNGNPSINVTLTKTNGGGKRFDSIYLRAGWFEANFDPNKITDPKERNLYYMSIGKKGRNGKLLTYLGSGYTGEFDTPQQIAQVLNAVAVGREYWITETQRLMGDNKLPSDKYNINPSEEPPTRPRQNSVWLDKPEPKQEEVKAVAASGTFTLPATDEDIPF